MKILKTVKKGRGLCLIFAVLFLCTAMTYIGAVEGRGAIYAAEEKASENSIQTIVDESEKITEGVSAPLEKIEGVTESIIPAETGKNEGSDGGEPITEIPEEAGTEPAPQTESEGVTEAAEPAETEKNEGSDDGEPITETAAGTESVQSAESEGTTVLTLPAESEGATELTPLTESEKGEEEVSAPTENISVKEELSFFLDENWQDCAIYRPGLRARLANPTVHRDDSIILSYLDFPCYFKYVTNHGQDIGNKTLAAYCVYNTREAAQNELYKPDGKTAFSKEITYCLYNGCRYKGKTAYNSDYSTGNWKKDYYLTQIAIHIINYEQGRESSIEKYLNESADSQVYKLVRKMVKDAYADNSLTSSLTNQTTEVSYTVTPKTQTEWIQQPDGTWRTAVDYSCSSNAKDRVVSVTRSLNSEMPNGTTIVVKDQNDPLSSFYFQATPEAYRKIAQNGIEVTARLRVTAEEYGGWWYEPADSSVKRQYITYLALEAGQAQEEVQVTASEEYFEQKASLTVYKEGQVLTGAEVDENGVQFQYTTKRISGAAFELRAGEDIKNGAGEGIWKKDAVVAANLVTNAEGFATVDSLYMGRYYLVEKTAPTGMVLDAAPKEIVLTPENDSAELTLSSVVVPNKRQKIQIRIEKKDSATKQPLSGAVFGVYAGDEIQSVSGDVLIKTGTLLGKATTNEEGTAVFQTDLPVGHSYYLKELRAPVGYIRDENQQHSFSISSDPGKELQQVTYSCTNISCRAELMLQKKDRETGEAIPQGDAVLSGAKYGLFAREEIVHPDGRTGVLFQKDQQVAVLETDELGMAKIENLYLGKYYLKELTAPEGYVLDEREYEVEFSWNNDATAVFQKNAAVEEQVKEQAFQIIKRSDKGETDPEALWGAGFTVWLLSDLEKQNETSGTAQRNSIEDANYNTTDISPVVIGPAGETELFTDENGYLCTIPLPYGRYLVRETTVPENHKPVKDFIVVISEHSPEQPQPWRVLLDESFMAKLKIVKKDRVSGNEILVPGAEFKVKNLDTGEYVNQKTSYPEEKVHTSYFTNEEGYLTLPRELAPGHYLIEEITAPHGYILSSEPVEITIAANEAFMEGTSNDEIIVCQEIFNEPVSGTLQIQKTGEVLTGFDGAFQYEERPLSGVCFEILAEENILVPDNQTVVKNVEMGSSATNGKVNEEKDNAVLYEKGTLVAEVTTDENGLTEVENLPLGTYRIREKKAPFGFIADGEGIVVTLSYEGQEVPVVVQKADYHNERQKIEVTVQKKDKDTGNPLSGAVFGLYAAAEIKNAEGHVIASAGACIGQAVTDEKGSGVFNLDLPHGRYVVKEEQPPAGYIMEQMEYELDLRECDGKTPLVTMAVTAENQKKETEETETEEVSEEQESETVVETEPLETEKEERMDSSQAVKTGDNTDIFGLLCVCFLSGEALLALLFFKRKLR